MANQLKKQLGVALGRLSGPDELICRRIGLTLGALVGNATIATLQRKDVDAVICSETREWETCEYLRDAAFFGRRKGMLVVSHANSEEPGMEYLVSWLRPHLPGMTITHVGCGDPLHLIWWAQEALPALLIAFALEREQPYADEF